MNGNRYALRRIASALVVVFSAFCATSGFAQTSSISAFSSFVKNGEYEQANFYLSNKLINPAELDTSQLFYDVFSEKFADNILANAGAIDTLYNYLNALTPINFNRAVSCGYERRGRCLLANDLLSGAKQEPIAYFVERGLDLNYRAPGIVPATVPLLMRLGSVYSIEDLNFIVSRGLALGADTYGISELASFNDDYIYSSNTLTLPANYLTLKRLNMLDMLVIALATSVDEQPPMQSLRRRTLCEFITYAAPSFAPTFDYLNHVLDSIREFRGENVGQMQQVSHRREVYEPFPEPCVTLVHSMAVSHQNLVAVIDRFAASSDTQTANWFISIRNAQQAQ